MIQKRVTMKDVADVARVTPGTVSRALRGDPLVKNLTRQHIVDVARSLNYSLNMSARALRTGSAGNLALACATGSWVLHHPYFAPMHSGFISAAAAEGVRVTIYLPAKDSEIGSLAHHSWPTEMLDGLVDGCVIYQAQRLSLESLRFLRDSKLAVVFMNLDRKIPGFFQIVGNAEQRVTESVRWGRELGARRFAVLGLSPWMIYINGALRAGIESVPREVPVSMHEIQNPDPDDKDAIEAALVEIMTTAPDAVIFNSAFHLSCFLALQRQGRFPGDIRLFCHDLANQAGSCPMPGVHYLEADLLAVGELGYKMIKDAKAGKKAYVEYVAWRRRPEAGGK